MANRYLRGTFTRNAWDFYELGAAFIYGSYLAPIGGIGFVLNNNGVAQSYIDLFRVEVTCQVASTISWNLVAPGTAHNSIEPFAYFNRPVQLDLGAPPGDMDVTTTNPASFPVGIKSRLDLVTYDSMELANGGPFLTLPPLWGIAISFNFSAPSWMAMSAWYQSITDHTPPVS